MLVHANSTELDLYEAARVGPCASYALAYFRSTAGQGSPMIV